MKQIIAFGDSNTWGLNPVLKNRYPENVRWTGLLRNKLSRNGFVLIEEGLCGRTTVFDDPDRSGLKGVEDIGRILSRHDRWENDTKSHHGTQAQSAAGGPLRENHLRVQKEPELETRGQKQDPTWFHWSPKGSDPIGTQPNNECDVGSGPIVCGNIVCNGGQTLSGDLRGIMGTRHASRCTT